MMHSIFLFFETNTHYQPVTRHLKLINSSKKEPTEDKTAMHSPPPHGLFTALLFSPPPEVPISVRSFLVTFLYPIQERPTFRLALDRWPKSSIFGNLSSFICKIWPSHLNLSFNIALKSGITINFLYSLLFVSQTRS